MITPTGILVLLSIGTLVLILLVIRTPDLTRDKGGKILAFLGLFILPVMVSLMGGWSHLEHSKSTDFCLSCHVMEPFGESLTADDPSILAASHYQNNRVSRDRACYSCHTSYTMYGGLQAKWRGLRHVYVYYLGDTPEPDEIQIYEPYHNRECLRCHEGANSFEEFPLHDDPEMMAALTTNETSCLVCHDMAHGVNRD